MNPNVMINAINPDATIIDPDTMINEKEFLETTSGTTSSADNTTATSPITSQIANKTTVSTATTTSKSTSEAPSIPRVNFGMCPVCNQKVPFSIIEVHTNQCLNERQTSSIHLEADLPLQLPDDMPEDDAHDLNESEQECVKNQQSTDINIVKEMVENNVSIENEEVLIHVRRHSEFQDFTKFFQKHWNRRKVNYKYKISFVGEPAIDTGGISREFYTEALKTVKTRYFQGDWENGYHLVGGLVSIGDGTVKSVGHLMASSIVNGGPAPTFLSPWLYHYILSGCFKPELLDYTIDKSSPFKKFFDQLEKANTNEEVKAVVGSTEGFNMMESIGYKGNPSSASLEQKSSIIQCILIKAKVEPCLPLISELVNGLKCYDVYNLMKSFPCEMKTVFCPNPSYTWKFQDFSSALKPSFCEGNRKLLEVEVFKAFLDFAEFCFEADEPEITSKMLLQFITGAESLPVRGLPSDISVKFLHDCETVRKIPICKCLPTVSTCDLQLTLPTHTKSEEDMKVSFTTAILDGSRFGAD